MKKLSLTLLFCVVVLCHSIFAQGTVEILRVTNNVDRGFGYAVAFLDDIDLDGTPDLAVGAPLDDGNYEPGTAFVLSGVNGATIYSFTNGAEERWGSTVGKSTDIDGDGIKDIFISKPTRTGPGYSAIYSGANGTTLLSWSGTGYMEQLGAYAFCNTGDVDGDGVNDIGFSEPHGTNRHGKFSWYSGVDGSIIRSRTGSSYDSFGYSLANMGDANGDGIDDIAIGSPFYVDYQVWTEQGQVGIYSGLSGGYIWKHTGAMDGNLGYSLANIGDYNGDGINDVIVGDAGNPALILSGVDGSIIRQIDLPAGSASSFGRHIVAGDDFDGDAVPDFCISDNTFIYVYSGFDMSISHILSFPDGVASMDFGADIDGNGSSDLLVGSWYAYSSNKRGAVIVVGLNDIDSDADGLFDSVEVMIGTDPFDQDTDDDGLGDQEEYIGTTSPLDSDTDGDGLLDGQELGLTAIFWDGFGMPGVSGTDSAVFVADTDPATTTLPDDADTDDDGLLDGEEDADADGSVGLTETDPNLFDTDLDALGDGLETGLSGSNLSSDTDISIFVGDADPLTTTNPLAMDTDAGGMSDGDEDLDGDGALNYTEFDPNDPSDDRFDLQITPLFPGQLSIFSLAGHKQGSTVVIMYSLNGTGFTSTPYGFDSELAAPLFNFPRQIVFTASSTQVIDIPSNAPAGLSVWFQGVERLFIGNHYRLTPVVAEQV